MLLHSKLEFVVIWKCTGILKMHRNPKNARESRKCIGISIDLWKKYIFVGFFSGFLCAREYRKFGNTEREYRIPENPVPGKFGNTEFPKNSDSRTSVFPKEKNSGMAPPWLQSYPERCGYRGVGRSVNSIQTGGGEIMLYTVLHAPFPRFKKLPPALFDILDGYQMVS